MQSWKCAVLRSTSLCVLLSVADGCLGSGGGGSGSGGSGGAGGGTPAPNKRDEIASKARSYRGSKKWLKDSYHSSLAGAGDNKCNIFVADVLKEVDADAPNRHFHYSPIGANEWADANSHYLTADSCWSRCYAPDEGDVIAIGSSSGSGHVGIVTGFRKTTSAAYTASPRGKVVENDWGFRSGQNPTCWRYTC